MEPNKFSYYKSISRCPQIFWILIPSLSLDVLIRKDSLAALKWCICPCLLTVQCTMTLICPLPAQNNKIKETEKSRFKLYKKVSCQLVHKLTRKTLGGAPVLVHLQRGHFWLSKIKILIISSGSLWKTEFNLYIIIACRCLNWREKKCF